MNEAAAERKIILKPRLEAALNMLMAAETVLGEENSAAVSDGISISIGDIGCDHGRLSVAMLQRHIASHVIASDISPASLDKARTLARICGVDGSLECRVSDGFAEYSVGEIDKAVIAGMGGELIAAILDRHSKLVRGLSCIVMQPMRGESELREYLYKNEYIIMDERVVFDGGRYYQLICARGGVPAPLPDGWPKDFWQFGAVALEKRDPCLIKLMYRYLEIIVKKLIRASGNGHTPINLLRELDCTKRLIKMYNSGEKP